MRKRNELERGRAALRGLMTQAQPTSRSRSCRAMLAGAAMAVGADARGDDDVRRTAAAARQHKGGDRMHARAERPDLHGCRDDAPLGDYRLVLRSSHRRRSFRSDLAHGPQATSSEMTTSFLIPTGTTYVADSLRIVPGTGTANVRAGQPAPGMRRGRGSTKPCRRTSTTARASPRRASSSTCASTRRSAPSSRSSSSTTRSLRTSFSSAISRRRVIRARAPTRSARRSLPHLLLRPWRPQHLRLRRRGPSALS